MISFFKYIFSIWKVRYGMSQMIHAAYVFFRTLSQRSNREFNKTI